MRGVWTPAEFLIAMPGGPVRRQGYVYRGLGMFVGVPASPKGRRPPLWGLTHLGSGHGVARICGIEEDALRVAAEIAEAGDWNFDSITGWQNHFPDARERVLAIIAKAGRHSNLGSGSGFQCEAIAREITMAQSA